MTEKNRILYIYKGCVYCEKVVAYIQQHNLDIPIVDMMQDPSKMTYLYDIGGKAQAPCLVTNEVPLYESEDILRVLNKGKEKGDD